MLFLPTDGLPVEIQNDVARLVSLVHDVEKSEQKRLLKAIKFAIAVLRASVISMLTRITPSRTERSTFSTGLVEPIVGIGFALFLFSRPQRGTRPDVGPGSERDLRSSPRSR